LIYTLCDFMQRIRVISQCRGFSCQTTCVIMQCRNINLQFNLSSVMTAYAARNPTNSDDTLLFQSSQAVEWDFF
jgi:hypothetical protein